MRIAVGSDHAGFMLKNRVRDLLKSEGHEVVDFGTHTPTLPRAPTTRSMPHS